MLDLLLRERKIETVFDLIGKHENDITFSLAWALSQSSCFLNTFLQATIGIPANDRVVIRLQQHQPGGGITDIEIESPGDFFIIVEAKRGWSLPVKQQLQTYANRTSFAASGDCVRRIFVLSECTREYATRNLEALRLNSVEVVPISWKETARIAESSFQGCSHAEKRLLRELLTYLRGLMTMQNVDSNSVLVVSLSTKPLKGWKISPIEVVTKSNRYFHPVGGRWPKEPPNYIAFRYHGRLQSIHHIEGSKVFKNPHDEFREIPNKHWPPHFLYTLGPAFGPDHEVKTGPMFRSQHVKCMLDTLFTSKTIAAARDVTKKRMKNCQ
jgi:hypothetical protein